MPQTVNWATDEERGHSIPARCVLDPDAKSGSGWLRKMQAGQGQAWCAEFLLKIDPKVLPRKIGARFKCKITLISPHIDPDLL
jgi:hypothetical protein